MLNHDVYFHRFISLSLSLLLSSPFFSIFRSGFICWIFTHVWVIRASVSRRRRAPIVKLDDCISQLIKSVNIYFHFKMLVYLNYLLNICLFLTLSVKSHLRNKNTLISWKWVYTFVRSHTAWKLVFFYNYIMFMLPNRNVTQMLVSFIILFYFYLKRFN